jgi:hypothetical protein
MSGSQEALKRQRSILRTERGVFWALVAVIVTGVASFVISIVFAQHAANGARDQAHRDAAALVAQAQTNAEKFTSQFCKVIVILDDQYKTLPQAKMTPAQRQFVQAMHDLRSNYRCDSK